MACSKIEDKYVRKVEGPFAVVRECLICGHIEKVVKGRFGVGRGYGFREGNKVESYRDDEMYQNVLDQQREYKGVLQEFADDWDDRQ